MYGHAEVKDPENQVDDQEVKFEDNNDDDDDDEEDVKAAEAEWLLRCCPPVDLGLVNAGLMCVCVCVSDGPGWLRRRRRRRRKGAV